MKGNIYISLKLVSVFLILAFFQKSIGQTYLPITVSGFNMDIVSEGTGNSSLAVTSDIMDLSNHVICNQQFAIANSFTTSPFGLPNNGTIVSGNKTYQMQSFNGNNALNIYTSQTDTLFLSTPSNYNNISIAALSTENNSTINIIFNFSDGTSQTASNVLIPDWCTGNGLAPAILQSYGRMIRSGAPLSYSDASNGEPEIFSFDYTLPCSKTLVSISFKNVSSLVFSNVTRAFILAVSGVGTSPIVAPVLNKDTLCKAGITTLAVQNPQSGLTYNWYNAPTGGTLLTSGTSYSPVIFTTSSYYVQAINAAGCTSPLIGDTIILGPTPVLPIVNSPLSVCSGAVSLIVNNPQVGLNYQWYSASTGGVLLGIGNPYILPSINADTAFYVESINKGGCESKRTQLKILVNSPIGKITGLNIVCLGKQITLSDTTKTGIWGITNNLLASINSTGIITSNAIGKDTVIYTRISAGGCKDTTIFPFTINPLPIISAITGTSSVCIGNSTQLNELTVGGVWNISNPSIATIDTTGKVTGVISGNTTVKYIVTDKNGCKDSVPIPIVVNKPSVSNTPISICPSGYPYSWNGNSYNAPGTYTFHLNNAVGCDSVATLVLSSKLASSFATSKSICPSEFPYTWNNNTYNAAGTYTVHLTNAAGCDSAVTLTLSVKTITIDSIATSPSNPVGPQTVIQVQVVSSSSIDSAKWTPSFLFANNNPSQSITALDTTFWIKVTGYSGGCFDTATKQIVVSNNSLFIPNAFAPSVAGNTEISTFKIYSSSIKNVVMRIFNQWGQLVKELDDPAHIGWDGTSSGKLQPSGVYVYVVKITYLNNKTETKSGSINLIR